MPQVLSKSPLISLAPRLDLVVCVVPISLGVPRAANFLADCIAKLALHSECTRTCSLPEVVPTVTTIL